MAKKEYIDREPFIKNLTAMKKEYDAISIDGMIKALATAPAADVVEVRRGGWIIAINSKAPVSHAYISKEKLYICPYCGEGYLQHMNFCGNCGAKMVRERAEETL